MPLSASDKLGPYEILAAIGAGCMGQVWKARDPRLDRVVVIKDSSEQFSERFEFEARSVAALNHPHICQMYDAGPDYLLTEFVEGVRLEKAVESGPSFGVLKPLFQTRVLPGVSSQRVSHVPSRDGKRFLVNTETGDPPPNPITAVLNWTSGLKK